MTEKDFEDVVDEEPEDDEVEEEVEDEEDEDDDDDDDDEGDDEEDEDDLKDPIIAIRKNCVDSYECKGFKHAFTACQSRVKDDGVKENCTPEFFDLLECRDKCVGHSNLFDILK